MKSPPWYQRWIRSIDAWLIRRQAEHVEMIYEEGMEAKRPGELGSYPVGIATTEVCTERTVMDEVLEQGIEGKS